MKNTRIIWREKNREKINAQARARRAKNKEKVREMKKRYYRNNRDKVLAHQREYMKDRRKNNPEKCKAYAQKRISNNPEHISEYRENYYLSSYLKSPCQDHQSNQETNDAPMNACSQNRTEMFDFSIA
jgi:hypothetical protein